MAPKTRPPKGPVRGAPRKKPVTLKALAQHLQLSPTTVSLVINRSPAANSIPPETHERVLAAARELNYRPNYMARSLRRQKSLSVGVIVPEISEGYAGELLSGVEDHLMQAGYFYLVASHRAKEDVLDKYLDLLRDRLVEGYILLATPISHSPPLPTVAVAGHQEIEGVTNVVIDHDHALDQALTHLVELGHQRIAFFKGHPNSADTEDRWRAILEGADRHGLKVDPDLTLQLSGDPAGEVFSPDEAYREGYVFGRKLLERSTDFTTLFAFNDISAIGATRAFLDAGFRVPEDISVVGFDDIQSAAFHNPSLTTVRQPLREMGRMAAEILLRNLAGETTSAEPVMVKPELVVRDSTAPPRVRSAAQPQRPLSA